MRLIFTVFTCLYFFISYAQTEATLLGTWSDDSLIGSAAFDNTYNEIWGYAADGKEYAIIGTTEGTHFIDVTDPRNPEELFLIKGADTGSNIIHRDYHDLGCYLYAVCDEGPSTLQIIDMSNLPNSVDVIYDENILFSQAHNIFIEEETNRLYAVATGGGPVTDKRAMRIYDISEPSDPKYLNSFSEIGGFQFGHVHDTYVRNNIAYLNLGNDGFMIADMSDAMNPIALGTLTEYPQSGYNHSGWLDDSGSYYYMADETWGTEMKVLDVSDPADIQIVEFFGADSPASTTIAHNQVVACDYLYVSYYYDGLQVYDISNPASPTRSYFYDTSNEPDAQSYKGTWGVYPFLPSGNILAADMQEGLFVFEAVDTNCDIGREDLCEITNVNSLSELGIEKIYPNPVSGQNLSIELNGIQSELTVEISNLAGRTLQAIEYSNIGNRIDIPLGDKMSAGMYILKLNGQYAHKFVKL